MRTHSGEGLKVLGKITVDVKHGEQHGKLFLYVIAGDGPTLLNGYERYGLTGKLLVCTT